MDKTCVVSNTMRFRFNIIFGKGQPGKSANDKLSELYQLMFLGIELVVETRPPTDIKKPLDYDKSTILTSFPRLTLSNAPYGN